MVARAERHFGHDDHLRLRGGGSVERGTDREPTVDFDRREVAFPQCVPILRFDAQKGGASDAVTRQQRIHFAFAVGQPLLGDVGFEPCALLLETLEREIGQFGRQNLRLFGVGRIQRQFDVIHNIM